ncbi:LysR family transcriptional regulator [Pseudaquidulcibacter saccharophilus]|uniref:LysR family transcriptional regulator n=1 Tax=Pseudaquidulcibacter saccharophilus TaxID=2831900 RepID=UPI001EFF2A74|nr:LysR family transcriptional regulator [Pseudaquidulcibacter saccharophilus]
MIDWDKLRTFHASADTGSLTAAAEKVGLSQSAVSRQIAALEEDLGVPLFHRHARGLILTGPGKVLQQSTLQMATIAAVAESNLKDARDRPQGELLITAPIGFGSTWLAPRLGEFMDAYPEVTLRLILDDRELDLTTLEAECAVRLWQATHADLIQRKLFSVKTALYASKSYVEANGAPQTLADLDKHRIIAYGASDSDEMKRLDFALTMGRDSQKPRTAAMSINNITALVTSVAAGLGIGGLPTYLAEKQTDLVPILPENPGPELDVFFIYPADLRRSKRIAAFRQYLIEQSTDWKK